MCLNCECKLEDKDEENILWTRAWNQVNHLYLTLSNQTLFSRFLYAFLFFSIGSLGRGNSTATVSAIVLDTAVLKNTTNGLRIKTWQVTSQFLILVYLILLVPENYDDLQNRVVMVT